MSHVIITTANIAEGYESRKRQYINSIETCLKYASLFDSYTILECVSDNEDYLNQYNVFYSKENNPYSNKGLNELNHLKSFLKQSSFNDTDGIIKLSGKYMINNSYFFEKVLQLKNEYDSIFKNDDDVYAGNGYHTFFYYIKKKVWLDTIKNVEFSLTNNTPIEWDFKEYLMVKERHIEIDKLGITAYQGANSEKVFVA
jgi:hypothetical protein